MKRAARYVRDAMAGRPVYHRNGFFAQQYPNMSQLANFFFSQNNRKMVQQSSFYGNRFSVPSTFNFGMFDTSDITILGDTLSTI